MSRRPTPAALRALRMECMDVPRRGDETYFGPPPTPTRPGPLQPPPYDPTWDYARHGEPPF